MGAPVGNEFWKLRSKHGREKIFKTPEELWTKACEYFEWCTNNPLTKREYVGKEGEPVDTPLMRAFTWSGLEYYLDIDSLREYKTNPSYKEYSQIVTRIEKVLWSQKFEGAASGIFNSSIIARDLGLTDKQEVKAEHTGNMQITGITIHPIEVKERDNSNSETN